MFFVMNRGEKQCVGLRTVEMSASVCLVAVAAAGIALLLFCAVTLRAKLFIGVATVTAVGGGFTGAVASRALAKGTVNSACLAFVAFFKALRGIGA